MMGVDDGVKTGADGEKTVAVIGSLETGGVAARGGAGGWVGAGEAASASFALAISAHDFFTAGIGGLGAAGSAAPAPNPAPAPASTPAPAPAPVAAPVAAPADAPAAADPVSGVCAASSAAGGAALNVCRPGLSPHAHAGRGRGYYLLLCLVAVAPLRRDSPGRRRLRSCSSSLLANHGYRRPFSPHALGWQSRRHAASKAVNSRLGLEGGRSGRQWCPVRKGVPSAARGPLHRRRREWDAFLKGHTGREKNHGVEPRTDARRGPGGRGRAHGVCRGEIHVPVHRAHDQAANRNRFTRQKGR